MLHWTCPECGEVVSHADVSALAALVQDHAEAHGQLLARNQLVARFRRAKRDA